MIAFYRRYQAAAAWRYLAYAVVTFVLAPVFVVLASWLLPIHHEHWQHLRQYGLGPVLVNTVLLLMGVSALSWLFGVSLGWILAQFEFWGSTTLRGLLILPLALPSYVTAFVYVGLLDYAGPLRRWLRLRFEHDAWIPEIRSLPGAIVLFSLALFPYLYVLCLDAFSTQGRSTSEAARSLGATPWRTFRTLSLPFARPWIAGGLCLVALEVLNDYGTVSVVGVNSFTTAIYKVWFGFFSPETAAQLASFLILISFLIYGLEQSSRRRRQYVVKNPQQLMRSRLKGSPAFLASLYVWSIFGISFVIPCAQLLIWAWAERQQYLQSTLHATLARSLGVGVFAALLTCAAAGVMVLAKRYFPIARMERCRQLANLGYGIPGSVLAIGVFLPLVKLDHMLVDGLRKLVDYDGGLIITGSLAAMVLALTIRFIAVAGSSLDAGMQRISPRLDEAASVFGVYGWGLFRSLHWPLLRMSFGSAFLLAFVDIVKEMPLTLMTRPFGWDTLSVRIASLISEGEWQRAAVPASLLVGLSLLPLSVFIRKRM